MSRPVHFEILAEHPEAVAAFYQKVFGWTTNTWTGSPQSYWLINTGPDGTVGINGGIMHRHFPQAISLTMAVDSLDETIAKIEASGGQKILGPDEIPGIGLHAYFKDPDGNIFGVLQPIMK
ncbi:MAG: VOC family protein [candidate division Zixibacteria bacterium]|nr:VOC family protein [candidate division Zixibacteria bacterium]